MPPDDDKPSIAGRIVRSAIGVGVGAAVGGWLGYFGAQVTNSDWTRISDQEKTSLRQSYTRVGVGVGALAGYFLRPKAHAPSRLPQPFNVPARTGRLLLASGELRRSIATNALEAIEMGRPEWIQQQRKDEAAHGSAPENRPVESTSLVVYVGDEKVGAIETLRDIAIPEISELRFYDARDARRRWGGNHNTARSRSCRRVRRPQSGFRCRRDSNSREWGMRSWRLRPRALLRSGVVYIHRSTLPFQLLHRPRPILLQEPRQRPVREQPSLRLAARAVVRLVVA